MGNSANFALHAFPEVGRVPLKVRAFCSRSHISLLVKLHDAGTKGEHESLWRRSHLKSIGRVMSKEERLLPKIDYYIDESDPDIVILRRQDGTFVVACSARGAPRSRQGGLLEAHRSQRGPFGPSRRRRPKEERLSLERPYSPECVEGKFSEVPLQHYA
jgi:hypothetical protein